MATHVLYYAESDETSDGWQRRLGDHGYDVWRTTHPEQLSLYARSRSTVGVILDASMRERSAADIAGLVRTLRQEAALVSTPIIALLSGAEGLAHADELAQAGATGIFVRGMPHTLLLHYLNAGRSIQSLRILEDSGMTVQKLAAETRKKIHDLSQPLAALQGRLQILQSKTTVDDPQKSKVDLMVKLTLEVGTHLRELQEFHRKYG
jgi:CheY-like chemotaxis protein